MMPTKRTAVLPVAQLPPQSQSHSSKSGRVTLGGGTSRPGSARPFAPALEEATPPTQPVEREISGGWRKENGHVFATPSNL